jgi:hypothetical protein
LVEGLDEAELLRMISGSGRDIPHKGRIILIWLDYPHMVGLSARTGDFSGDIRYATS